MPALNPIPSDDSTLIRPDEVAAILGVSLSTLERWRCIGGGPPYLKVGRRKVAYLAGALRQWLQAQERAHTAA